MRFSLPSGALQVAAKGLESQGQQTGTGDGPFPHQGHHADPYIERGLVCHCTNSMRLKFCLEAGRVPGA